MRRVPDLERAAMMAYRVLAAREIRALPVDPLPLLRACRDTVIMTADDAADVLDMRPADFGRLFDVSEAVTFLETADGHVHYIILYRPGGNPARLRFTLAHELGHRVLRHTAREYADEREADCFASHLLCPQPAVKRMADPAELVGACYVSLSCAKAAMRRQGIADEFAACRKVAELLYGSVGNCDAPKGE